MKHFIQISRVLAAKKLYLFVLVMGCTPRLIRKPVY